MSQQKTETNNLTTQIVAFLNEMGHFAWRNNTIGVYDMTTGRYRKSNSVKGTADIFCVLNPAGQTLFIEIKVGRDRLRDAQEVFRDEVVKRGAIHWEIKTIENFIEKYKKYHATHQTAPAQD